MKTRSDSRARRRETTHPARIDPISDSRFQDLLLRASAFFAEAERDFEGERKQAIAEIIQTMNTYGLTVNDLK
jgi:hypothetical protein